VALAAGAADAISLFLPERSPMYVNLLLLLSGGLAAGGMDAGTETQFDSYTKAWHAAADVHKPMLVILNPPADEVSTHASISVDALNEDPEIGRILEDYVVAEIDTSTEHGRLVHELFGSEALPRVVVIDNDQEWQVYRTSRQLAHDEMVEVLEKYRSGEQVSTRSTARRQYRSSGYCPNCRRF
jgi:hypothetical protein